MDNNSKNTSQVNARLTTAMVSQDFQPENCHWNDEEKKSLGDCWATAQVVLDRFAAKGLNVIEAYAIHHYKEEHELWLKYDNPYITTFTSNHIHIVVKFPEGKGATRERIAEIAGVNLYNIGKPKPGRYSYSDMLCHLIHMKYPEEYQYSPSEVITLLGKRYIDHYREKFESWNRDRTERIIKDAQITLKDIRVMIIEGKVTKKDLVTKPEFEYVYQLNKTRIDKYLQEHHEFLITREGYLSGKLKD